MGNNICWSFVPARGGSKSVPLKNMRLLAGRPLIDYVVKTALSTELINQIHCSTEHPKIVQYCEKNNIVVHHRPKNLCGDDINVIDVMLDWLKSYELDKNYPDFVALLMPTSPFISKKIIEDCISALINDKNACSVQTVISCPHNFHAVNQRNIVDGYVDFFDRKEHEKAYNKQKKSKHYIFGNMIVTRTISLFDQHDVFARPSIPIEIDLYSGLDVDQLEDFKLAEIYIQSNRVILENN